MSATAAAQDDPRLTQAVEHFNSGEYVEAATLLEEVEREAPSNLLTLNAMAAWYKADRCPEAMDARARVDVEVPLDPQDIEDMDRVNAYCKLKAARAFKDAKDWDKALGLLAGLETRDTKLAADIVLLRKEVEAEQRQEKEAAEKPEEVEQPEEVAEPVEPPPEPPAERPTWALGTGLGLLGGGIVLGAATLVKWQAIDQQNADKTWDVFREAWNCTGTECEDAIPDGHDDRDEYERFQKNLRTVETTNIALGVTSGVLGAAGAGLLVYYLLSDGGEASAAVIPLLAPGQQGAAVIFRF